MTALLARRTGRRPRGAADAARGALLVVALVAVEFGAAVAVAVSSPWIAVAAIAGAVGLAACVLWPVGMLSVAFAATFFPYRVGPTAADMSLTDAVAIVAVLAALPYVPWRSRHFRRVLMGVAGYCAVISISVVANPGQGAAVGVVHRFEFVMGAVCIGAAVARLGRVTTALRALVVTAAVMSLAAIFDSVTHGFAPAYPFRLQKNGYATLACSCFLVLLFAAKRLRWPRSVILLAGGLLLGGIAASQSRGVGLALVAVLAIFALRSAWKGSVRRVARLAPLILLVTVSLVAIAVVTFTGTQADTSPSSERFTSVGSRVSTYEAAWNVAIKPHPVLGAGPGWFSLPGSTVGAPHDIAIGELSEVGALGLLALCWLLWRVLQTTNRIPGDLGTAAWYVLLGRVLASTVDIFWVAGPTTLPFMIVGLAIGAAAVEQGVVDAPKALPLTQRR